jgi:hypothetical protein
VTSANRATAKLAGLDGLRGLLRIERRLRNILAATGNDIRELLVG